MYIKSDRWCIISGPRSGTGWLEDMIFRHLNHSKKNTVKLHEFFNYGFSQAPFFIHHKLDCTTLDIIKITCPSLVSYDQFLVDKMNCIKFGNQDQSFTMRLFNHDEVESRRFENIVDTLYNTININSIILKRSAFDRALSWYFMKITNVVHHRISSNSIDFYSFTDGKLTKETVKLQPIVVDIDKWRDLYANCIRENQLLEKIGHQYNLSIVNYENLIEDCIKHSVPIHLDSIFQKTYSESYQNNVINFQELLEESKLIERDMI
jgi:hypothetical protein